MNAKRWLKLALLSGALLLAASCGSPGRELRLFIWSEYIDPKVLQDFERQWRCRVVVDLYEDEESMLAKIQGGGGSLYDVVVPPEHMVPALVKLGLLAPLDLSKIPNVTNIDEQFLNLPFDRSNHFTVPYQWGTLGLYLRRHGPAAPDPTWGLVFDPKLQKGPFVLIDSMRDLIGSALKYLGHTLNSANIAELNAAKNLLLAAKRRCLAMDGSVGGKNKVLAHLADAAIVYSGEGARGMKADPDTIYLIPKEGSQIWLDNLAILAQAPHRELAEAFLNFALDPAIGARISIYTQFSTPNRAAKALLPRSVLNDPAVYPPPEVLRHLEFLRDLGEQTRRYDEIWTEVKSK